MKIHESAQNYLEAILILEKRNGFVRSIDIANELEFSKPSVSIAMKHLRNDGYIETDENGYITLLEKGRQIAEEMYERHTLITSWFKLLGVSDEVASQDACKIEHAISKESFDALKKYLETLNQ